MVVKYGNKKKNNNCLLIELESSTGESLYQPFHLLQLNDVFERPVPCEGTRTKLRLPSCIQIPPTIERVH